MVGDCRAACSGKRAQRAETRTHAASRSPSRPSVAVASPPAAPCPSPRSVHAAGISDLLPSGSTSSSSSRPCRRKLPSIRSGRPFQRMPRTRDRHHPRQRAGHQPAPAAAPAAAARGVTDRTGGQDGVTLVQASHGLPQIDQHATGNARRDPQHLPLATRARQPAVIQRGDRAAQVDRRTSPCHQRPPAAFHGCLHEILAGKPRAVPDQQLNRCLRAEKAFRPRAQRRDKVIEARSKAG